MVKHLHHSMKLIGGIKGDNYCSLDSEGAACWYDLNVKISEGDLRISRVHDYKDRFILQILQKEAFVECPGFKNVKANWKSKIAWINKDNVWVPAGYYMYSEMGVQETKYSEMKVVFPLTLHQIYVIPDLRRLGICTFMMLDFISMSDSRVIWIESPFDATKHILRKLGYKETEERYELWQMMEGLSKWIRIEESQIGSEIEMKDHTANRFSEAEMAFAPL
ncbi:MAG: hypothetical protein QXN93_03075 [Methanomassiliicoccales archaeon]